jgi:hypothetical protein
MSGALGDDELIEPGRAPAEEEISMSSLSISGSGSLSTLQQLTGTQATGTQGTGRRHHHSPIDAVASTLKMSTDDITAQLQQGKSLEDLAKTKGVSHDDLISALKAGMPSELKSSDDGTAVAEQIAATAGLQAPQAPQGADGAAGAQGHHHHGHHNGSASQVSGLSGAVSGVVTGSLTSSQQTTLDSLSSLLGTDSSSLLASLKSGTSLADLVASKGVDSGKLAGVLQDGLLVDTRS